MEKFDFQNDFRMKPVSVSQISSNECISIEKQAFLLIKVFERIATRDSRSEKGIFFCSLASTFKEVSFLNQTDKKFPKSN